ncbi:hypothetical protein LTR53_004966 [Teratosphaeriaceae sp. CCFEE 6253]|nr:hypothetical protein LTR53_004966 [Teratosphaeriaceae sp. CCFEE 6253]
MDSHQQLSQHELEQHRASTRSLLGNDDTAIVSEHEKHRTTGEVRSAGASLHDESETEGKTGRRRQLQTAIANTSRSIWRWRVYTTVAIASAVLPVICLILWFVLVRLRGVRASFSSFSSERIGGTLTQSQAKAVDVVCSIVIAPVLIALLNHFWFAMARVAAVNERHSRHANAGVPLSTLAVVSNSSSGSYRLTTTYTLLHGKSWRLALLAALILLSAVARSALSNLLAYEAFTGFAHAPSVARLRYLADQAIFTDLPAATRSDEAGIAHSGFPGFDHANPAQQADVANQITGLLTSLSFQNASAKLTDGAYIHANVTTDSIVSLLPTVVGLDNIPGYRLSLQCKAHTPELINVTEIGAFMSYLDFSSENATEVGPALYGSFYRAAFPGLADQLMLAGSSIAYQFAAFSPIDSVYLAYLAPGNLSGTNHASSYGAITPRAQNMTEQGRFGAGGVRFEGDRAVISFWGILCGVFRQEGLLNYTRVGTNKWNLSASAFGHEARVQPSSLKYWQTYLNYHAPNSFVSGLGPALALSAQAPLADGGQAAIADLMGTIAYETLAQNYLYAEGETQRTLYELAANDPARDRTEYHYSVDGTAKRERYRMTYVPAILLTGLLSLLLAAGAAVGMAGSAAGTHSARTFRDVDAVRLVVDAVEGLGGQRSGVGDERAVKGSGAGDGLEEMAEKCRVRYVQTVEDGEVTIKLRRVDRAG